MTTAVQAATNFAIGAAPNPVTFPATPTVTETTPLPAGATGTVAVTFTNTSGGANSNCTITLPAISCGPAIPLTPDSYNITATYSGGGLYAGSNATDDPVPLTDLGAPAPFTITQSGPITAGQSATLTANGLPLLAYFEGGTVTFTNAAGGALLCTATLPALGATCGTSTSLAAGTYQINATYTPTPGGDSDYASTPATNEPIALTVLQQAPAFTIAVSPAAPASVPYPGTTAVLSETGLTGGPTGTVTFSYGGNTLCTVTLPTTSCSPTVNVPAGTHTITGTYSGDATYGTSTATNNPTLTVAKDTTSMTNVVAPASGTKNVQIPNTSISTTLSGGTAPTGTITFTVYTGTCTLANQLAWNNNTANVTGNATYHPTGGFTPTATYTNTLYWKASYSGDANNSAFTTACTLG